MGLTTDYCHWWEWDFDEDPPECWGPDADSRTLIQAVVCDPTVDRTQLRLLPVATCGRVITGATVNLECIYCGGGYDILSRIVDLDLPPGPGTWVYYSFMHKGLPGVTS